MTHDAEWAADVRTIGDADFAVPIEHRYFEDYQPGASYEYGHVRITEAQIRQFAEQFDPQPMHTDPVYAADGGLIASGWHTASVFTRLFVDHYLSQVASLASPGMDELRWPVPVRPGDVLRMRVVILQARSCRSKPDRGLVHTQGELINQRGETVFGIRAMNLLRRGAAVEVSS